MFKNTARLALDKLSSPVIAKQALTHDDLIIYFDCLISDYASLHFGVNCEEFKATISKYDLLHDADASEIVEEILDTISKLSPNYQEK